MRTRRIALGVAALPCAAISCALFFARANAQDEAAEPRTPEALRRPADQTYLTYPEWFLVFSPEEYADWVETRPPTDFPFLDHVGAVWAGYVDITSALPESEPVNWGYHAMICTIAGSTAVEYTVRSAYESTVGRVSAATVLSPEPDGQLTAEDRHGAEISREYEQFLRQRAWYEFDYVDALTRLWTDVPFTWASPIRALERRYALTTEYVFKMGYAQLLASASHATFDEASFEARTSAMIEGLPEDFALSSDAMTRQARFDDGAVLVTLPRYEAFMPAALEIARAGGTFVEIAGNRGRILVSVRGPVGLDPGGRVLRRDPISTQPGRERVLFDVPVAELAGAIHDLVQVRAGATEHADGAELEHIYDF